MILTGIRCEKENGKWVLKTTKCKVQKHSFCDLIKHNKFLVYLNFDENDWINIYSNFIFCGLYYDCFTIFVFGKVNKKQAEKFFKYCTERINEHICL